jgi:hypothetical protein
MFLALGVAAVYGLDRLAVWMESRGWIYWRHKSGSSGSLGSAFLEVQSLFEPSKQHMAEVRRTEHTEEDDSGDPPSPDGQSVAVDRKP